MSVTGLAVSPRRTLPGRARQAFVALAALLLVGGALALLVQVGFGGASAPPARDPFGTGLREAAAPAVGSLGARLLAIQGEFYRAMTGALERIRVSREGGFSLALVGFLYGVFHAAGPGHGKAV
ncbi:MAG: nickel transporter, partial [Methylobacteriaceae bacterium]|nr:nickel transporter [Methylobacteriaceae bacterium]